MRHGSLLALAIAAALGGALGCASAPVNSDTNQTREKLLGPDQSSLMDVDVRSQRRSDLLPVSIAPVQAFDAFRPRMRSWASRPSRSSIRAAGCTRSARSIFACMARSAGRGSRATSTAALRRCTIRPTATTSSSRPPAYVAPVRQPARRSTLSSRQTPAIRHRTRRRFDCASTGVFEQSLAKLVGGS